MKKPNRFGWAFFMQKNALAILARAFFYSNVSLRKAILFETDSFVISLLEAMS